MKVRGFVGAGGLLFAAGLFLIPTLTPARENDNGRSAIEQDRVVAGGPKDFMEVRRLVLKGTNEEIGRALATIGRERLQMQPTPSDDRLRTRVQRKYIEKHYPILFERMRGVAAAFGQRVDDDAWNFNALWYFDGMKAGCSVVHYPANVTAAGAGIVSRNYDFSTGTLHGTRPPRGELPATARPYIVEMHPDRGYASIALYSYDLLSGVMDGINSEGLTVTLLADDELLAKFPMEPAGTETVGLGVVQVLRLLLDSCASAEEAKEALLMTKQYYEFVPVHYLIADRHGKAFVWEYSQAHNRDYIIENPHKPLITTNFSLHRYLEGKNPPSAKKAKDECPRYCTLAERLAEQPGKLTVDFIKESHKLVDMVRPGTASGARAPVRTLWHALYFPEQRKMEVSFYLRDEVDPEKQGDIRVVRTDYLQFALKNGKAGK